MQKVIVVGAGIIGASIAYHLQKAGAQVTVVDSGGADATAASFGWINASFYENAEYFRLRIAGIAAFRDLAQEVDLPVAWCGCLSWEETGAAFDRQRDTLRDAGYAVEEIGKARFAEMEPAIANGPERSLFFPGEAAAESAALARCLLDAAVERGAQVVRGVFVKGFVEKAGKVSAVRTDVGEWQADQVIIAAGIGTAAIMETLGVSVPLPHRPAVVVKTPPMKRVLSHILATDFGEVRQLPDGSLLMPAVIGHQSDASVELSGSVTEVADEAMTRLRRLIPSAPETWAEARLAFRPVPQDGMPMVGATRDGAYVAVMHSGITLAAVMGRMIAEEVMTSRKEPLLKPFRPLRFN